MNVEHPARSTGRRTGFPSPDRPRIKAFTLIELIVVILIIAILGALILGVVRGVREHARRVAATKEVRSLEQAWKAYFAHYKKWPSFATETDDVVVTGIVALVLQGEEDNGDNRDRIQFAELSRFDANDDPVNPWGYADRAATGFYYRVRFDVNYDNVIDLGAGDTVRRPIAVWTVNPREDDSDKRIIGSWR